VTETPAVAADLPAIRDLAQWSTWYPVATARSSAPRLPGVYLAREGARGPLVYVGMAGERDGNGTRAPQGLWGRLGVYSSGKGAVSGLGEAVFDRALADPDWLAAQLEEVRAGRPTRAKAWAASALARADIHLCWSVTADGASAHALERAVLDIVQGQAMWNRAR
jgi:hypothetical protein